MGQLDDRTALVTGASSGTGPAIARRFAAEPAPPDRVGRPDEVAATALYPAGDQSTFPSGAEPLVDGGATQL
ncbi:Rossmann-fold NAD(P)-binding domain-containing protein [Nocardiopsis halophila]|uniref:hypothetical protein n=1 Tax=Nocardiopsis halophila TaxID=141692 RepID=UPI00034D4035|nr:hypothetical protein [Nocardiopsis halophila]